MICPHCNTSMREVTKTGILIDVCPHCQGVWLGRGELEKILTPAPEVQHGWEEKGLRFERWPEENDGYDDYERRYEGEGRYRKRRYPKRR